MMKDREARNKLTDVRLAVENLNRDVYGWKGQTFRTYPLADKMAFMENRVETLSSMVSALYDALGYAYQPPYSQPEKGKAVSKRDKDG